MMIPDTHLKEAKSVQPHRLRSTTPDPAVRPRTLVIGLGNPLIADDRVGLCVASQLRRSLRGRPDVDVVEDYWGGLRLMERMIGYDRAIVIDAICTGAPPGTLHRLTPHAVPTQKSASAHDVNLPTALAFGRAAGASVPEDDQVVLVGIEALDTLTFSEDVTPAVAAAVPRAVELVLELLNSEQGDGTR